MVRGVAGVHISLEGSETVAMLLYTAVQIIIMATRQSKCRPSMHTIVAYFAPAVCIIRTSIVEDKLSHGFRHPTKHIRANAKLR